MLCALIIAAVWAGTVGAGLVDLDQRLGSLAHLANSRLGFWDLRWGELPQEIEDGAECGLACVGGLLGRASSPDGKKQDWLIMSG